MILKTPFPYFGGKSAIADLVWDRIGDVDNWIEPFFGSGAVTLLRPASHTPRLETVNDLDAYVANFWRATQREPDAVAEICNWPVNEADLEARHKWLVEATRKREHAERMRDDPDYYDVKIAAWWCWGLAQWIGGGWCAGEWHGRGNDESNGCGTHGVHRKLPHLSRGMGVHRSLPHLGSAGMGVHRSLPHLGSAGMGVHRSLPHLGSAGRGEEARRGDVLREWFQALRDRLRAVRVACGDWKRVCDSHTTTLAHSATCGLFLDPPYSAEAGRDNSIYSHESTDVAHDCREWCERWGAVKGMRIALCGYEGEGHEALEALGWDCVAWKAQGGYGNQAKDGQPSCVNRHRERLWFSPGCTREPGLFDGGQHDL